MKSVWLMGEISELIGETVIWRGDAMLGLIRA